MNSSRRDFLKTAVTLGGTAAAVPILPGCVSRRVHPPPVTDVDAPVAGLINLTVGLYPALTHAGGALTIRPAGLESHPLLVVRVKEAATPDTFRALSGLCTHAGCPVGFVPEDNEVECPCHGSRFNFETGAVLFPPAKSGIKIYGAVYDATPASATFGLLAINLLSGDASFPALKDGQVVFPLGMFAQLGSPGGSVMGVSGGLGKPLLVIALADGTYSAVDATCTHLGCVVEHIGVRGDLECPCHGSKYALDGTVTQGPAQRSLTLYRATRQGDAVIVDVCGDASVGCRGK